MSHDRAKALMTPAYHEALIHLGQATLQQQNLEQQLSALVDKVAFAKRQVKDALRHAQSLDGSVEAVGHALADAAKDAPHSSDEAL